MSTTIENVVNFALQRLGAELTINHISQLQAQGKYRELLNNIQNTYQQYLATYGVLFGRFDIVKLNKVPIESKYSGYKNVFALPTNIWYEGKERTGLLGYYIYDFVSKSGNLWNNNSFGYSFGFNGLYNLFIDTYSSLATLDNMTFNNQSHINAIKDENFIYTNTEEVYLNYIAKPDNISAEIVKMNPMEWQALVSDTLHMYYGLKISGATANLCNSLLLNERPANFDNWKYYKINIVNNR
jgi:hypothetical protein